MFFKKKKEEEVVVDTEVQETQPSPLQLVNDTIPLLMTQVQASSDANLAVLEAKKDQLRVLLGEIDVLEAEQEKLENTTAVMMTLLNASKPAEQTPQIFETEVDIPEQE